MSGTISITTTHTTANDTIIIIVLVIVSYQLISVCDMVSTYPSNTYIAIPDTCVATIIGDDDEPSRLLELLQISQRHSIEVLVALLTVH